MRSTKTILALLLALAFADRAAGAPACFEACVSQRSTTRDDHFSYSADAKRCRDRCDAAARERTALGSAELAGCRAEPLSREDFRALRAASPAWRSALGVFSWTVENTLTDRVLVEIAVATQDMNLVDVEFAVPGLVPPGERGTFVVPDFFDGYPAVRLATRVTGIKACRLR